MEGARVSHESRQFSSLWFIKNCIASVTIVIKFGFYDNTHVLGDFRFF